MGGGLLQIAVRRPWQPGRRPASHGSRIIGGDDILRMRLTTAEASSSHGWHAYSHHKERGDALLASPRGQGL